MHVDSLTTYDLRLTTYFVITPEILERLGEIFRLLCTTQKCELVEFNGSADHVHLLVDMAPDIAVSKLVNILKTISSREIRREFPDHVNKFYWKSVFWTSAYCAFISWWRTIGCARIGTSKTKTNLNLLVTLTPSAANPGLQARPGFGRGG